MSFALGEIIGSVSALAGVLVGYWLRQSAVARSWPGRQNEVESSERGPHKGSPHKKEGA